MKNRDKYRQTEAKSDKMEHRNRQIQIVTEEERKRDSKESKRGEDTYR